MATRDRTPAFLKLRVAIPRYKSSNRPPRGGDTPYGHISGDSLLDDMDAEEQGVQMEEREKEPEWMAAINTVQNSIARTKTKIAELQELHREHLKPRFDDQTQEQAIDNLTSEITKSIHLNQAKIKLIGSQGASSDDVLNLQKNIKAALAGSLQELSASFKASQKSYKETLQARSTKGRKGKSFIDFNPGEQSDYQDAGFDEEQIIIVDGMNKRIAERERDIEQISKSIKELSDIFKDLSALVIDQGTILDRIDYNIEQTGYHVEAANESLGKASEEQKKFRTGLCVLLLCIFIFVMVVVILIKGLAFGRKVV
eukprot:TRINITY_DN642_c0_g1_i2.p1 TRINITY_DN642_c0_g1~~TRINITY_DN642_c0_g1_i2.p1  ORF type:complete len:313 (-),score=71.01 TRINITY_DN642_c0_g1_i2:43-981(-)